MKNFIRKIAAVAVLGASVLAFAGCADMMGNGMGTVARNTCAMPVYTKGVVSRHYSK